MVTGGLEFFTIWKVTEDSFKTSPVRMPREVRYLSFGVSHVLPEVKRTDLNDLQKNEVEDDF